MVETDDPKPDSHERRPSSTSLWALDGVPFRAQVTGPFTRTDRGYVQAREFIAFDQPRHASTRTGIRPGSRSPAPARAV